MAEGFLGNVDTMMLFFRICRRYGIKGEKERVAVLRELVKRKTLKYIPHPEKELQGKTAWRIQ